MLSYLRVSSFDQTLLSNEQFGSYWYLANLSSKELSSFFSIESGICHRLARERERMITINGILLVDVYIPASTYVLKIISSLSFLQ